MDSSKFYSIKPKLDIGLFVNFDKVVVVSRLFYLTVQRGNVQCVQGAYGEPAFEELDEIFLHSKT